MPIKNMTSLLNFRHRVVLATSYTESPTPDSTDIVLVREAKGEIWASINPTKGTFFVNGQAMQENRNAASHYIVIRYNRDIDITGYGWIYEKRPSGMRWYKITSVEEMGERQRYWQLQVRLTQKGETVNPPGETKYAELPEGARL